MLGKQKKDEIILHYLFPILFLINSNIQDITAIPGNMNNPTYLITDNKPDSDTFINPYG